MSEDDGAPLDKEQAAALYNEYGANTATEAGHTLALSCAAAIIEQVAEEDHSMLLAAVADQRHGVDVMHRLEYLRAYQDRLHDYALPDMLCASRMLLAARRSPPSPGAALRSLKEIAGLLGRMDGNARVRAKGKIPEPFEAFDLAWSESASRAGREGEGPALAAALVDARIRARYLERLFETEEPKTDVEDPGQPDHPTPGEESVTTPGKEGGAAPPDEEAEPTPVPEIPRPQEQVTGVTQDDDLDAVVSSLRSGATVSLAAGEYYLNNPLWIQKDVRLRGEPGARIVGAFSEPLIRIGNGANFYAAQLEIASEAVDTSSLLQVEGAAEFHECRFEGARAQRSDAREPLELRGVACNVTGPMAMFHSCVFADNDGGAVQISGDGRLEMVKSRIKGGAQAVVTRDRAVTSLRECEMVDQRIAGLLLSDTGRVAVKNSKISGYHADAGVVALDNTRLLLDQSTVISEEPSRIEATAQLENQGSELRGPSPFE